MSTKSLKFAAICPHPPIIIPTIGSPLDLEKVSKTIKAMEKLAKIFAQSEIETLIIISPHSQIDFNNFLINHSPTLVGHFYNFGDFQTELIFKNDLEVAKCIEKESQAINIPARKIEFKELDHGTLVPIYYLSKEYPNFKIVPLSLSFLDLKTHFQFGKILKKATDQLSPKKIGIVASGDLSHRLTFDAPAGYSPRAHQFDEKLIKLLRDKNVEGILNMDQDLVEEAGECGYRSIIILLGALSDIEWHPEILSYQAPFGVGYLVANFILS